MRYALGIGALIVAACTFPPENPSVTVVLPVSPTIEVVEPREEPKAEPKPAPKEKPKPKVQPASPCVGMDTGDAKESINAKLDCMLEQKP